LLRLNLRLDEEEEEEEEDGQCCDGGFGSGVFSG
jgi:hypothetical protein